MSDALHDEAERALLRAGTHHDPHRFLGVHASTRDGVGAGRLVRAFHPDAVRCEAFFDAAGSSVELASLSEGVFEGALPAGVAASPRTRVRFHFADGQTWERVDPYGFTPTLGALEYLERPERGIREPVVTHAESLVLGELLDAIAAGVLRRW